MALSNDFNAIVQRFQRKLKKSYLEKDDIFNVAYLAFLIAQQQNTDWRSFVEDHLTRLIQKNKKNTSILILDPLINLCPLNQKMILRLLHGFHDGQHRTHQQLASMLRVSEKSIKLIEKQAIHTIQSLKGFDRVRAYFLKKD